MGEAALARHVESASATAEEEFIEDVRDFALGQITHRGVTPDGVRVKVKRILGEEALAAWDTWYDEHIRNVTATSVSPAWRGTVVRDQGSDGPHYPGPQAVMDVAWSVTEPALATRVGPHAMVRIDSQSTDAVASFASPHRILAGRRGLLVGHVQSGKTANYTAIAAKAADWGYRLVVVLTGLHTQLRRQTQRRLDADLVQPLRVRHSIDPTAAERDWAWHWLTSAEADFSRPNGSPDAFLQSRDVRLLVAMKKNHRRLEHLIEWLGEADVAVRERCPVLVIDDEADQASINTARRGRSTTNRLLNELLGLLPSSTYVALTATPFANVLIDPYDESDLYPRDFIIAWDEPAGYQGAKVLFGRNELEGEEPDDGHDLIRIVDPEEITSLVAPTGKEDRQAFEPSMTSSLETALHWFLLATAARRVRGQTDAHSSCLVHTSRYVDQHRRLAGVIRNWVEDLRPDDPQFQVVWDDESGRDVPPTTGAQVAFADIALHLPGVLEDVRVAIDNGEADPSERLDYEHSGQQTVIAVGGDTLSRGLTLEGLVSSYFLRASRTYDALMQMGRWFGFRPGYEDLPRVWSDEDTIASFRHLSTVEAGIRRDIGAYGDGVTPMDLAVRIQTHPSMGITSAAKMGAATKAQVSYARTTHQTTFFEAHDAQWLAENMAAGDRLVRAMEDGGERIEGVENHQRAWRHVDEQAVRDFLAAYRFHPKHAELDAELILSWLDRRARHDDPVNWNVAVAGRSSRHLRRGGGLHDLGEIKLGGVSFNMINRSRRDGVRPVDIGALISPSDRVIDLPDVDRSLSAGELIAARNERARGTALLVLYVISPDSLPPVGNHVTRHPLNAAGPLLGVLLVLPDRTKNQVDDLVEAEYVSVDVGGVHDDTDALEELWAGAQDDEADAHMDAPVGQGNL